MSDKVLLVSIKPQFAEQVFHGKKRVELRRVRPNVKNGDTVYVYVSSPVKALVGFFKVKRIIQEEPQMLWSKIRKHAGISRKEFDYYYSGASVGYGIAFDAPNELPKPISLEALRDMISHFSPPQCYHYFDRKTMEDMISRGSM